MSAGRSVWRDLFSSFVKSLKFRSFKTVMVGEDHAGNKYYEAPLDIQSNKKYPKRWYEPKENADWQQDLPAEWEAWLRGRRQSPPSDDEINQNLAIAQMKKQKGDELRTKTEEERNGDVSKANENKGFPHLKEYETYAGMFTEVKDKHKI